MTAPKESGQLQERAQACRCGTAVIGALLGVCPCGIRWRFNQFTESYTPQRIEEWRDA